MSVRVRFPSQTLKCSSEVEPYAHNVAVAGSNPAILAKARETAKRLQIAFHNDVPGERQKSRCGADFEPLAGMYGFSHSHAWDGLARAYSSYRNDRLTVCQLWALWGQREFAFKHSGLNQSPLPLR